MRNLKREWIRACFFHTPTSRSDLNGTTKCDQIPNCHVVFWSRFRVPLKSDFPVLQAVLSEAGFFEQMLLLGLSFRCDKIYNYVSYDLSQTYMFNKRSARSANQLKSLIHNKDDKVVHWIYKILFVTVWPYSSMLLSQFSHTVVAVSYGEHVPF